MKHAARIDSSNKDRPIAPSDMDVVRARVDIEVEGLSFSWVRPSLGKLAQGKEKSILSNVNAHFPAGKVTAVLVCTLDGFSSLDLDRTYKHLLFMCCTLGTERSGKVDVASAHRCQAFERWSPRSVSIEWCHLFERSAFVE